MVCQIPPAPPRPDFDASREKLQKLGEGEGSMTKEEFSKMKQELEAYVTDTIKIQNHFMLDFTKMFVHFIQ